MKAHTQERGPTVSECKHHWIISTPQGPVTASQCKICYEERDFTTPYDATNYGNRLQRFPKVVLTRVEDYE